MYYLEDTCLTWNEHPSYIFLPALIGRAKTYVFKFTDCHNTSCSEVYTSPFWIIYAVTSRGLTKPAGYIFEARGEISLCTMKAISSCKRNNSKDYIAHLEKTKPWSANGLDLIRYEEAGEVITDLCTVMGVDVTVDLDTGD